MPTSHDRGPARGRGRWRASPSIAPAGPRSGAWETAATRAGPPRRVRATRPTRAPHACRGPTTGRPPCSGSCRRDVRFARLGFASVDLVRLHADAPARNEIEAYADVVVAVSERPRPQREVAHP